MADLGDKDSSLTVKLTGAATSGAESNFVDATTNGGMHVNLRNNAGTEIGTPSNPVRVDPTGTTTQPISAVSLPLPTGASTESTLLANGVLLGTVTETAPASDTASSGLNGRLQRVAQRISSLIALIPTSLGQKTSANSFAVVVASDQSTIPVSLTSTTITGTVAATQSGTWNITNVSGTVSLPTGASTSALQTSGNASLTSIDGKLNSLGQKAMTASVPVTIASDQSAVPASQSGTWNINNVSGTVSLPTGAATAANQATANASLSSIDGKISTTNGQIKVTDALDGSGVEGTISVGTTATAVRVGVSNLTNRENMTFENNGTQTLFWGYRNTVTISTGTPIFRNQLYAGDWGPNTTIYIIATSGTHDVRVTEGA